MRAPFRPLCAFIFETKTPQRTNLAPKSTRGAWEGVWAGPASLPERTVRQATTTGRVPAKHSFQASIPCASLTCFFISFAVSDIPAITQGNSTKHVQLCPHTWCALRLPAGSASLQRGHTETQQQRSHVRWGCGVKRRPGSGCAWACSIGAASDDDAACTSGAASDAAGRESTGQAVGVLVSIAVA